MKLSCQKQWVTNGFYLYLFSDKDLALEADRLNEIEKESAATLETELEDVNLMAEIIQFLCAIKEFKHLLWSALENLAQRFDCPMAPDVYKLIDSR